MKVKLKSISIGIICLLILSGFIYFPIIKNDSVSATTLYVGGTGGGNYSTIQTAITAANVGDTVYVYAGNYNENIIINKRITLVGAGQINTTIDGGGTGHVIHIFNSNGVSISGFKITNGGTNNSNAGIAITYTTNCLILNNNVSSNGFYGLSISVGDGNTIKNNTVTYNQGSGIVISNISINNNIINNIIDYNCLNKSSNEAGLKIFVDTDNNRIIGNEINNNNKTGILFLSADSNLIQLNSISGNQNGIYFQTFDYNNIFYFNEFINNTNHVAGTSSSRSWNSIVKITYLYNNTNFTNYLGNYWDNYAGIDSNGDGIGDTSYNVGTENDLYPLMKLPEYYTVIPSSTNVDLVSTYSNSTKETVSIVTHNATLSASITGDFNGTINFTGLQFIIINSGFFTNKGFFRSSWTSTIGGNQYQGGWHGMLFSKSGIRKYYLKGTLFGDFQGVTDGDLAESTYGSGIYDIFNSTSTLNCIDSVITYSQIILNGTVGYQKSTNSSTEIYILQSLFIGNATGYYNKSLNVVLTHVRINNLTHGGGKGFSIISYISEWGSGSGWTYDRLISSNTVNLTGFFTEPLWGIIFGELVEFGSYNTLSIEIIRLDLGSKPAPIIQVEVWGPWFASPGDTIEYIIEYRNIGLKPIYNVEIVFMLSNYTQYISNTGNGNYNATYHQVTWVVNISAKSKGLLSVRCRVNWGLSWGTKLNLYCYIMDWSEETVLATDTWTTIIRPAGDPNAKHGPVGSVIPGQKLTYTIEFENEGLGKAYGVYFTDTLCEYLDDSTLEIGPVFNKKDNSIIALPGIYDHWSRTITWFVDEVGPGEGGFANFNINIRSDAILGSTIINYGTVYFPSVPEITKTNGIVNIIQWNQDPIANAGTDLVVMTIEEIIFDGSASIDPDGEIVIYNWDFGDGEYAEGKTVSHTYQDDGNYKVKLNVSDNNGGTNEHEITVRVLNRVPVANLEVDQTEIYTNEQVNFSALNSTDIDGVLVEYNFDFGDGSSSGWIQTKTASHIYTDGNVYTVKLTVKDDDGNISTNVAELEITVKTRKLIAKLTSNKPEAFTYEDILFDASLSADPDGSITGYHFDFGDNTNSGWVTTSSVSHQFMDGTKEYTIQLLVMDEDDNIESAELIVTIKNRDPVASAGLDKVTDTNQNVNFNGELSSDKDGKVISYTWDFGDGETGVGKTIEHIYTDNGEYIVTLTVADDDGAMALDACKVTVNNVRPIATFIVSPSTGDINTEFEFSSTSFDTDGFITSFYWDFGDGMTSDQAETTHHYTTSGIYNVSLIVWDDDGMKSDIFNQEVILSKDETDHEENTILISIIILIITILIIIILIIPLVIRKRKQRRLMLGEPFTHETLRKVSQEVLTDSGRQNLSISRKGIKNMLESSHEKGELSEEAYDYITDNVLYSEEEE